MSSRKTLLLSIAGGFVIATLLHVAAFAVDNKTISGALLWQDTLFVYLTGPGPLLFVDDKGKPHYEGTPILALILPVGYIVSLPIYSLVTFLFILHYVRTTVSTKGQIILPAETAAKMTSNQDRSSRLNASIAVNTSSSE